MTFQGRLDEAGPLYDRSLAIREKALGPDHPHVATALNNRAALLRDQVRAMTILQDISCGGRQVWFEGTLQRGGVVLSIAQVNTARRSGKVVMPDCCRC